MKKMFNSTGWLAIVFISGMVAGCGPDDPPRMKNAPTNNAGSTDGEIKLKNGTKKPVAN